MVIDEEYAGEVSAAYWEEEMKAGIYLPSIFERIKTDLKSRPVPCEDKGILLHYMDGSIVRMALYNAVFGNSDYLNNKFITITF